VSVPELELRVVGAEEVAAQLLGAAQATRQRLRAAVQGLGLELLTGVKEEKLSGQVLGVRTGRGRRSVHEVTTEASDTITSRTGTDVGYMRAWELGFDGDVQVRAHDRLVRQVFGRPVAPTTQHVGPSTRHVHMAARPWLGPSLAEMRERVRERLSAAVSEALNVS
jgi:hypothetical protein